jgi:hypothetical protein
VAHDRSRVPWARHDSSNTRAFEDLIVYDAIASSKATAARHTFSWRAVNDACMRVSTEALGRIELHAGLSTIAIDEVKYKMGHKYLTVVCSHANRQGRSDVLPQRPEIDRPIALLAQTVVAPRPSPVLRAFAVVPHTGTEGLHRPPGHRSRHR